MTGLAHAAPETNRGSKWKLRIAILVAVLVAAIAIAVFFYLRRPSEVAASRTSRPAISPSCGFHSMTPRHLQMGGRLPIGGPGLRFANGSRSITMMTEMNGQVAVNEMTPLKVRALFISRSKR